MMKKFLMKIAKKINSTFLKFLLYQSVY